MEKELVTKQQIPSFWSSINDTELLSILSTQY